MERESEKELTKDGFEHRPGSCDPQLCQVLQLPASPRAVLGAAVDLRGVPGLAPGPRRRGLEAPQRRADPPRRAVQFHVVGQVRRLEAPPAASAQVHRPHLRIDPAPAPLPSWGPPFSRLD